MDLVDPKVRIVVEGVLENNGRKRRLVTYQNTFLFVGIPAFFRKDGPISRARLKISEKPTQ